MNLFTELKRRNVFRVAAAYVVISWVVLQIGDLLFDLMGLPEWSLRIVLVIVVLGFIPAVVFSWVYELTPEGIKKESEVDRSASVTTNTGRKLDLVVMVMIVLLAALYFFDPRGGMEAEIGPVTVETQPEPDTPAEGANVDDASIAVLPFLNLSADQEQEYFSDGLADTLLHRLAQLPDLRVAARTSSFKFKGQNEDMREIARQLGVATVLEGSVQRQGNRVRITAQLIKGSDGSHIWSKVFDDTLDDIFRVQDEIAQSVAEALQTTLLRESASSYAEGGTQVVAAYEAYLKALEARGRGTPEGNNEAVAQLELAVELDPDYALAWANLVWAYFGTARLGSATWESTTEPMMRAATRAVELAPDLAESRLAMSQTYWNMGRTEEAHAEIERAYELAPNHALAVRNMADIMADRGQWRDALRMAERALLLDPLHSGLKMQLAFVKMNMGNIDDALALARELVEAEPDDLGLLRGFSNLLWLSGDTVSAGRAMLQMLEKNPNFLPALFGLTQMHLLLWELDSADRYLSRVEAISPNRAIDDRAEFCKLSGDLDCYEENARKYLAFQDEAGTTGQTRWMEIELEYKLGNYDRAIELLSPLVELEDGSIDASDRRTALELAYCYGQIGQIEQRNAIVDAAEAQLNKELANGLWAQRSALSMVWISLLRDDFDTAMEQLNRQAETGSEIYAIQLENEPFYAALRSHPDYPGLIEKLRAREAEWLRQLNEP